MQNEWLYSSVERNVEIVFHFFMIKVKVVMGLEWDNLNNYACALNYCQVLLREEKGMSKVNQVKHHIFSVI